MAVKCLSAAVQKGVIALPQVMHGHPSNRNSTSRNTLPKSSILRGRGAFNRVFKHGNRLSGSIVDTRFLISEGAESHLLAGFAAGRRSGNAPSRNRAKRLMREAYRMQRHELTSCIISGSRSLHLVFMMKSSDADFRPVYAEIGNHLARITTLMCPSGDASETGSAL